MTLYLEEIKTYILKIFFVVFVQVEDSTLGTRTVVGNQLQVPDCRGSMRIIVLEENSIQPFRFN